jgi:hypothetical protein
MLVVFLVALMCALALFVLAVASLKICRRVGLDPVEVLLWLGLLERPLAVPRDRRRRLHETSAV